MWQTILANPSGANVATNQPELAALAKLKDRIQHFLSQCQIVDTGVVRLQEDVFEVFSSLRALRGVAELLSEQPGYRAHDPAMAKTRAEMAVIHAKVADLCDRVQQKCNPFNAADVAVALAPRTPGKDAPTDAKYQYVTELINIITNSDSVGIIQDFAKCKTIPEPEKALYLQGFGMTLSAVMEHVLKTSRAQEGLDMIEAALARTQKNDALNACAAVLSTLAVPVGNLPGPDTFSIALVRLRALHGFSKLMNRRSLRDAEAQYLKDSLMRHLGFGRQTKLADDEQKIRRELNEIHDLRYKIIKLRKDAPLGSKAIQDAVARVGYHEKNAARLIDDRIGKLQIGPAFNWTISILNILAILAKLELEDDVESDESFLAWLKAVDQQGAFVVAAGAAASGTMVAIGRSAVHLKALKGTFAAMERWGSACGKLVTAGTAVVSLLDGGIRFYEGLSEKDAWKMTIGGTQVASGLALAAGVFMGVPGAQPVGAIIGVAATVLQLVDAGIEACKDALRIVVLQLIKDIREKKARWNNAPIAESLGISQSVDELRRAVEGSNMGILLVDPAFAKPGLYDAVVTRVATCGFGVSTARSMVGFPGVMNGVSDFRARGLDKL